MDIVCINPSSCTNDSYIFMSITRYNSRAFLSNSTFITNGVIGLGFSSVNYFGQSLLQSLSATNAISQNVVGIYVGSES